MASEKATSFAKMFLEKTSHGKDAAVNNLNAWGLDSAIDDFRVHEAQRLVDVVLSRARQPLIDAVACFFEKPISPLTLMAFEITLLGIVRELGRQLLELVLNTIEPKPGDTRICARSTFEVIATLFRGVETRGTREGTS